MNYEMYRFGFDYNMLINVKNLDPSIHSLSYLLVLSSYVQPLHDQSRTRLPEDICPGGCLWDKAVRFLACFDPIQIRYVGYEWRLVVEIIAEAAEQVSKASHGSPVDIISVYLLTQRSPFWLFL